MAALSEDLILDLIGQRFPNSHPRLMLGRGDDCAWFRNGRDLCVSSDLFLEDVHFRRAYFEADEIGHKALAVNLSDLAACGAKPAAFTLCLGLPPWADPAWLDRFFSGMAALAAAENLVLAGGDLSRSGSLHISITVFGEKQDQASFLNRSSALPGDVLFLVGKIGLAAVGLCELERQGRDALWEWPEACAAHLRPKAQTAAGLILGKAAFNARPLALMDVSDGLLRDLPRLLAASRKRGHLGCQLRIQPSSLPGELLKHAGRAGRDPVLAALAGGEDYALLGACAPDMLAPLRAAIPELWQIGSLTDSPEISCNGAELDLSAAFDHFSGR